MDNNLICGVCGKSLRNSQIRNHQRKCEYCLAEKQLNVILAQESLDKIFKDKWAPALLIRYFHFLKESGVTATTVRNHVNKAKRILLLAEETFLSPSDITIDWLENTLHELGNFMKTSFYCFLEDEKLLKRPSEDDVIKRRIEAMIDKCPKEFRRLLEIFYKDKLHLRKRQVDHNEKKPVSLTTIVSGIEMFTRFVRWVIENYNHIHSWELIQENHVHEFLLSLPPKHREIVRKKLYMLFRLAWKKRLILYIPMIDFPSRELPATIEPLNMSNQKKVARIIHESVYTNPLGSILSALCFYHGLSSKHICNIRVNDVDISGKKIYLSDRPPVYLSLDELIALEEYGRIRSQYKNVKNIDYLFLANSSSEIYRNKQVKKEFILRKVKRLTGYSPKTLRITCFNAFSANFGPQMLIEAFGVSLTQASRYGKLEEYLLEEEIASQTTES